MHIIDGLYSFRATTNKSTPLPTTLSAFFSLRGFASVYSVRQRRIVAALIGWAHQYFNKLINLQKILIYDHQNVLPKGKSFTANSGTKDAVLPKGMSSTANSGTKVAVLLGMNWCGSFPLLSITYYVAGPYTIYFKWVLCLPGPR